MINRAIRSRYFYMSLNSQITISQLMEFKLWHCSSNIITSGIVKCIIITESISVKEKFHIIFNEISLCHAF